ncbi:hypothetical protein L9F63_023534, partial [Diploptera punctata]
INVMSDEDLQPFIVPARRYTRGWRDARTLGLLSIPSVLDEVVRKFSLAGAQGSQAWLREKGRMFICYITNKFSPHWGVET